MKFLISGVVVHASNGKVRLARYYRVDQFSIRERTYYSPTPESVRRLRRVAVKYPCLVSVYDFESRGWKTNHETLGMYAGQMSFPAALALNHISGVVTGFSDREVRKIAGSAYEHMKTLCDRRTS